MRNALALVIVCVIALVASVAADVYLHTPRGGNNRLNEANRDRTNDNRLFDSQNNDRGGSNVGTTGIPYYFTGSTLNIEWANQHSCGPNSNTKCEMIIQYMCDPNVRDGNGTTTKTIPERDDNSQCENQNCDLDPRYGRHESQDWYEMCTFRKRNQGLFTSNRQLNGNSAIYTRQNNNGDRSGYECPEERDYYPYWVWTPWRDIAVMTNDIGRCAAYQAESQNVKTRWQCVLPQATLDAKRAAGATAFIPLDKATCESAAVGGNWLESPSWNLPAPKCVDNWPTRDNHNGLTLGGVFAYFNWTIPADYNERCVLRLRYNMTSTEFAHGGFSSATSVQAGEDYTQNGQNGQNRPAELDVWTKYGLTRGDVQQSFTNNNNAQKITRGYVLDNNPTVDIFGPLGNMTDATGQAIIRLTLSINTNQFSRTFSDRSHMFSIRRRPVSLEPFVVHNVGVKGKRGNIVQTYPGVEYEFTPPELKVQTGDMVHFQWSGSDTNPNNNAGQGPNGYDRSNIAPLRDFTFFEGQSPSDWRYLNSTTKMHGLYGASYPSRVDENIGHPFLGFSLDAMKQLAIKGLKNSYFDLGPQQVTRDGTYSFLSTRNNAFSNRDQKGQIKVTDPSDPEQLALMLALGKNWVGAIGEGERQYLPNAWLEIEYVDDQTDTVSDTLWLEEVPSEFGTPYILVHPFQFTVAEGRNVYLYVKHDYSLLRDGTLYNRDKDFMNRTSLTTDSLTRVGVSKASIKTGGYYIAEGQLLWGYIALIILGVLAVIIGATRYYYVKKIQKNPKKWVGFKAFADSVITFFTCAKKQKVAPETIGADGKVVGATGGADGVAMVGAASVGAGAGAIVIGAAGLKSDAKPKAEAKAGSGEKARLTVTIRKPSDRTRALVGAGGVGAMTGAALTKSFASGAVTGMTRGLDGDEKLMLLNDEDDADVDPRAVVLARVPSAILDKKYDVPTRFGMWASNMAIYTSGASVLLGCCSIAWAASGVNQNAYLYVFAGMYCWIVAGCVTYWELMSGGTRTKSRIPVRAIVYGLICIFPFFTNPTMGAGLGYACAAIVNAIAAFYQESYVERAPKKEEAKEFKFKDDEEAEEQLCTYQCCRWWQMKREQNKLSTWIFVFVYFLANVAVFTFALIEWVPKGKTLGLSGYGPLAKGFGNLLDFNCAIIVVPVTRTLLKILYNYSTADQSCGAKMLRGVLAFVPLDLNLAWHKLIAQVILFSTAGHMCMHFFNYAYAPAVTSTIFGWWPWASGAIVCLCMLCIYAAARENVKEGQFEIFWYSHHAFIGFFFFLLMHGSPAHNYFNPNFWKWFLLPGSLYIAERLLRWWKANQPVSVLSVIYMSNTPPAKPGAAAATDKKSSGAEGSSDVLALEFDKVGVFASEYKEGQYLFLNCPAISKFEWHPFTISSAPQEESVTVHIRLAGEGSWTRRVYEYLASMGPAGASYFPLYRHGLKGNLKGKMEGPDGKQLFQIDGPHSAPTQHIGEYETVMVVGGGIGVTPVSSTLKSVVYHRWRSAIGKTYPNNAFFYWVISWKDIDCFRWLVRIIKDVEDEMAHLRATSGQDLKSKKIEFHIWVTSAPEPQSNCSLEVDDECALWGVPDSKGMDEISLNKTKASFSAMDLYSAMKVPDKYVRLGTDVHIRKGRPNWPEAFKQVATAHPTGDVGVLFCGNPAIAADLESSCFETSHGRKSGMFTLHKENF